MRNTVKPVSYAARATDERVTYLRIYADAEGETHMEEVDIALMPRAFFNGHPPLRLTETLAATGCNICRVPAGMGVVDWHNPPRRELVIWLTGEVEFETSDGDIRRLVGTIGLYRPRVGDWRAIFRRNDQERIITVAQVLPRGSAYQQL